MNTRPTQYIHATSRPPQSRAAMLCKSAVCAALLVGLAWIGLATVGRGDGNDRAVPFAPDSAAAHRRGVFEERRARLEERARTHVAQRLETPARQPRFNDQEAP
jgi:hypothetical protein